MYLSKPTTARLVSLVGCVASRRYMPRKEVVLTHCPWVIKVSPPIHSMGTRGDPQIELHACWLLLPAGRRILPGTLAPTSHVYAVENLALDHALGAQVY